VAASGAGNASNTTGSVNNCGAGFGGFITGIGCLAVSGGGNAWNDASSSSCGYAQAGVGCIAVSGTGDATNAAGEFSCGNSLAVGCVAVSGTGDATNSAKHVSCGWADLIVALGCVSVSGAGSASNSAGYASCGGLSRERGLAVGCGALR
jgi:hypothetical protein